MEATVARERFADQIKAAQELLEQHLKDGEVAESSERAGAHEVMTAVFESAEQLGLTDQEVVRLLLSPVATLLRPGLER